jgi:hypothetical protein
VRKNVRKKKMVTTASYFSKFFRCTLSCQTLCTTMSFSNLRYIDSKRYNDTLAPAFMTPETRRSIFGIDPPVIAGFKEKLDLINTKITLFANALDDVRSHAMAVRFYNFLQKMRSMLGEMMKEVQKDDLEHFMCLSGPIEGRIDLMEEWIEKNY